MLDNEQSRLLKKIEKTRARAAQIQDVKQFNEERAARLAKVKQKEQEEIREK